MSLATARVVAGVVPAAGNWRILAAAQSSSSRERPTGTAGLNGSCAEG
jgi:hypothetical protein